MKPDYISKKFLNESGGYWGIYIGDVLGYVLYKYFRQQGWTSSIDQYTDYKIDSETKVPGFGFIISALGGGIGYLIEKLLTRKKEEIQLEYCDKLPTEKEQIECKIELYEKLLKELKISMRFCEDESKRKECLNFIRKRILDIQKEFKKMRDRLKRL